MRNDWSRLNRLQLGKLAEYLVKMEFVLWGCDVFTSEVDDHGIDLVVRTQSGNHFDVQVKSFRLEAGKSTPYVFLPKEKFKVNPSLLLALVQFINDENPVIYLICSGDGSKADPIFESRDYGPGKKSLPEWGLTLSKKKLASLGQNFLFEAVVQRLQ